MNIGISWKWSLLVAITACIIGFHILTYDHKKNVGKRDKGENNYMVPSPGNHGDTYTYVYETNKCHLRCEGEKKIDVSGVDDKKFIIKLSKPRKAKVGGTFKGNHWFHMAEYYLSQVRRFDHRTRNVSNATFYVVASEYKMFNFISEMGMFLLSLAFTNGDPYELILVHPSSLPSLEHSLDNHMKGNHTSFASKGPMYSYSPFLKQASNLQGGLRFLSRSKDYACICGEYLGEVGEEPVDRNKWFNDEHEANDMRDKINKFCGGYVHTDKIEKVHRNIGKHLSIYQRDLDRRILNIKAVKEQISKSLDMYAKSDWTIEIVRHNELISPCRLYQQLLDTDVYLTTHGFQSLLLLFLPNGSRIIELFNYKYWKIGYTPLALDYGIQHNWLQNTRPTSWSRVMLYIVDQDWCMNNHLCRRVARTDDIDVTKEMVNSILDVMLQ